MWHHAILASTLLLPATLALQIDSHLATSTTLLCSTIYDTSSLSGSIPTTTVSLQQTLDLSPVILHNYTSVTSTVTPKPFSTLFSVLATKTKTTEAEAINGTFYITETRFGTSTVWEHATTTKTETKTRLMTSRTTEWIDAPTGFVGVRNNTISTAVSSASSITKRKRNAAAQHPHSKRQNTSQKPKLVRPTQGRYAVEVGCQQWVGIHTTEVLLLTAKKTATVTLRPETVYKNRTVYGTITSTILVSSVSGSSSTSPSTSTAPPSSTNAQNKRDQDATPLTPIPSKRSLASIAMALISPSPLASTSSPTSISTNTTTVTKTPYTISFTWTRTITTTSTTTLHATTTLTSYSACATSNLLSQTSNNKRINGVSLPFPSQDQETSLESLITETAAKCCENCVGRGKECLWSIWQAEGQQSGSCYLTLLVTNPSPQQQQIKTLKTKREKEIEAEVEVELEQQCPSQTQKAIFGYSGRNGEVRYVVSNGLCGFLEEA